MTGHYESKTCTRPGDRHGVNRDTAVAAGAKQAAVILTNKRIIDGDVVG